MPSPVTPSRVGAMCAVIVRNTSEDAFHASLRKAQNVCRVIHNDFGAQLGVFANIGRDDNGPILAFLAGVIPPEKSPEDEVYSSITAAVEAVKARGGSQEEAQEEAEQMMKREYARVSKDQEAFVERWGALLGNRLVTAIEGAELVRTGEMDGPRACIQFVTRLSEAEANGIDMPSPQEALGYMADCSAWVDLFAMIDLMEEQNAGTMLAFVGDTSIFRKYLPSEAVGRIIYPTAYDKLVEGGK